MKRVWILVVPIAIVMMALSIGAMAQESADRMNRREKQQLIRIRQGFAQGDLTRREAAQLLANHRMIRRAEFSARADGRVNRKEQMRLRRMQARANARIYWQRHDRQRLD
jgi:hypothetical protein